MKPRVSPPLYSLGERSPFSLIKPHLPPLDNRIREMPSVDYPADHNKTFDSPAAIDYVHILVYVSLLLRKGPRFLVTSRITRIFDSDEEGREYHRQEINFCVCCALRPKHTVRQIANERQTRSTRAPHAEGETAPLSTLIQHFCVFFAETAPMDEPQSDERAFQLFLF